MYRSTTVVAPRAGRAPRARAASVRWFAPGGGAWPLTFVRYAVVAASHNARSARWLGQSGLSMGGSVASRSGGRIVRIAHPTAHRGRVRSVHAAIWARFVKPSLPRMCCTWFCAVRSEMTSLPAISRLLSPSATSAAIWRSRGLSGSSEDGQLLEPCQPRPHGPGCGPAAPPPGRSASLRPGPPTGGGPRRAGSRPRPGGPARRPRGTACRPGAGPRWAASQSPSALEHAPRVSSTGPRQFVPPAPPTTNRPR